MITGTKCWFCLHFFFAPHLHAISCAISFKCVPPSYSCILSPTQLHMPRRIPYRELSLHPSSSCIIVCASFFYWVPCTTTPDLSTWTTAADVGYVWSGQPVDLFLAKHRHIRLIQIFTRLLIISLGLAIAASSSPSKCVVRTNPSSY